MASNAYSYLFSGSRGKILIAFTLFFFLTITVTFRGRIAENAPWSSGVGSYDTEKSVDKIEDADGVATQSSSSALPTSSSYESSEDSYDPEYNTYIPSPTTSSTASSAQSTGTTSNSHGNDVCNGFPDTSDILVIMKTGATEAYNKLPIHFMSDLRCVKDFVIYSDMKMNMAGYEIQDVLEDVDEGLMNDNDDFDLYRELQRVYKEHQDPRDLKKGSNGWNLDKYKFVPMMDKTWKYRQDAKWYVFIEADTFIQWENTMAYLNQLDPEEDYYIGSPTYLDIEFAHGGTGYVISHAAMEKAVGNVPDLVEQYASEAKDICCGDRMTSKILLDAGIRLTKAWPMFNGEKPLTLPYGENQWCQPVMTMHHMTAQEVSKVWNFEVKRRTAGDTSPMVWKDVFNYFVKANLRPKRNDWENLSGDVTYTDEEHTDKGKDFNSLKWSNMRPTEKASYESPEKCKDLCDSDSRCFQWMHHGIECQINYSIKLGWAHEPSESVRWVSGWNFERINAFRQEMQECNEHVDWSTSGP